VFLRIDYTKPEERERARTEGPLYIDRMIEAVSRVPGVVQSATVVGGLPLAGNWSRTYARVPGQPETKDIDEQIDIRTVSPGYLPLLRIPLLRGRLLTAADRKDSEPVIVINEAAARKYWPSQDALGQLIEVSKTIRVVVGIVGNIRHLGPEIPARQECYVPATQNPQSSATLVMRTAGDPLAVLPAVKAAVWSVNPEQRVTADSYTMEGYMDRLVAQRRFNMALLSLFGVLGLVISAVGIYGVMAYLVAQRTQEIGVRMALGATRGTVVSMVLRRATTLVVLGLVIGGVAACVLGAGARAFLFEIQPTDLRVFACALVTLSAAALVASAVPARRAATIDPLVALRQE
jgi:predicted permease